MLCPLSPENQHSRFLLIPLKKNIYSVWNGDCRLRDKYGDEVMEAFEEQTSVTPFAAILQGRQVLPADYWKEFVRLPYAIITAGTVGAYLAHPFMQAGSWTLHW